MQSFVAQRVEARMAMKIDGRLLYWSAWEAGKWSARSRRKREFARGARDFGERNGIRMTRFWYVAAGGAFYLGGAGAVLRSMGPGAVCDWAGVCGQGAAAGNGDGTPES